MNVDNQIWPKRIAVLGAAIFAGAILDNISSKSKEVGLNHQTVDLFRNLTKTRSAGSRDPLIDKRGSNTDVQLDSGKTLLNSLSTKPRSSASLSDGRSRTSKNIESSTTPSIPNGTLPIRKYPDYYYTLSEKSKWKYRKSHL